MKKNALIIIMCAMQVVAWGQTPVPSRDTLPCGMRQRNYYYSTWYDTSYWFFSPETYFMYPDREPWVAQLSSSGGGSLYYTLTIQQFASRRIRIRGLWAMVSQNGPDGYYTVLDTNRLPEYLYLYVRNPDGVALTSGGRSDDFLLRVASVRWDTAQPKMMCMRQTFDEQKPNLYCHVYEALFDTAITLAGEYWIGASAYSNMYDWGGWGPVYDHWPTIYMHYEPQGFAFKQYRDPYAHWCYAHSPDGPWSSLSPQRKFGPYGVIFDEQQYYVDLSSSDNTMGFARPTAYFPAGSYQTITATSRRCYRFSHWNDGDTTNPRTIHLTQDTAFIAYFDTVSSVYDVSVRSNDDSLGYAELVKRRGFYDYAHAGEDGTFFILGSDTSYCEGDSASMRAVPRMDAYFWYWSDSVMTNPRTIIVTQDTLLTAIFSKEKPRRPCPRIGKKPLVVVMDTGRVLLTWAWNTNVQHESWEVAWGLAGMLPDSCEIIPCSNFDKVFDSLEAGVRYVAYVRALCRNGNTTLYSDWSDSVEIYFPYFPHRYTVTVAADYAERGRVYGGGEYDEGDMAMLTANAWNPYRFLQWNDGDTANPRFVEVTQDTSFTALFAEREGITPITEENAASEVFLLLPNPASGSVMCVVDGETFMGGVLTMTDALGREVLRKELPRQTACHTLSLTVFPKGVYLVTLTTAQGSVTRKLVVE